MTKINDPKRVRSAWIRCCAAAVLAAVLLAVSGFGIFKMLGTPKDFTAIETPDAEAAAEPVGSTEDGEIATIPASQAGDYVQAEVFLDLDRFAEGSRGGTVTERYVVVPVNGKMVAFCFPQRWFESEEAIYQATQKILTGTGFDGSYIRVTGTVTELPESVSTQLYDWFGENKEWMEQGGMIPETDDYASVIHDLMVKVDYVGHFTQTVVVVLSALAGLCLLYALYELIRILCKGYAVKQTEEPAETSELEESAEEDENIEVEITESDPETGEDVTDVEVEITEETPEAAESEDTDGEA